MMLSTIEHIHLVHYVNKMFARFSSVMTIPFPFRFYHQENPYTPHKLFVSHDSTNRNKRNGKSNKTKMMMMSQLLHYKQYRENRPHQTSQHKSTLNMEQHSQHCKRYSVLINRLNHSPTKHLLILCQQS